MKLWLISQEANDGYDTYDSAVVVAGDERAAKEVHPNGYLWRDDAWRYKDDSPAKGEKAEAYFSTWAVPAEVKAVEIGTAADDLTVGEVVCSSFNAG